MVHGAAQQFPKNKNNADNNLNVKTTTLRRIRTSIPINRTHSSIQEWMADMDSVPRLNIVLGIVFKITEFKVDKVALEAATQTYLTDHFDDIM